MLRRGPFGDPPLSPGFIGRNVLGRLLMGIAPPIGRLQHLRRPERRSSLASPPAQIQWWPCVTFPSPWRSIAFSSRTSSASPSRRRSPPRTPWASATASTPTSVAVEAMRARDGHAADRRPDRDRRGRARRGADALRRRGGGRSRGEDGAPRSTSRSIRSRAPTSAPPARPTPSRCSPPPSAAACSTPPTSTWRRSSSARPPAARVHLDAPVAENLRNIAAAFEREVERPDGRGARPRAPPAADRRHPRGRRAHPPDRRRRPLGRHRRRGARHRRARGDGHRRRARGRDHRRRHALPRRRDPGAACVALDDEQQAAPRRSSASHDPDRSTRTEDLAPGEQILFACTGVTDGELLAGRALLRRRLAHLAPCSCRCSRRLIRFVDTHPPRATPSIRRPVRFAR